MPTRFHYSQVQSQNFALTPVEILMATDQELNEYMSIKKYAPYRQDGKKWDNKRNDRLQELKTKIAARSSDGGVDGGTDEFQPTKKRKGKKERLRAKMLAGSEEANADEKEAKEEVSKPKPQADSGKRKRLDNEVRQSEGENLDEVVENRSKKKRRRHRKKEASDTAEV